MKNVAWVRGIAGFVVVVAMMVSAAPATALDAESVMALVVDRVLDHRTDGRRVYVTPTPVEPGIEVRTWSRTVFTTGRSGWVVFVDDLARANFEHPCRYVFVDRDSLAMEVYAATTPPVDLGAYLELDTEAKRISDAVREVRPVPYSGPRRDFPGSRGGTTYAVLLSGGADQGNNHIRYYNDTAFMHSTLKEVYGLLDADIYVLVSDGTNPAPDRSDGTNSPPDLDGDGVDDIEGPCTLAAIQGVFTELAARVTAQDQVFFFTTDHGGSQSGWDVYLNLWGEEMNDDVLAGLVNALPPAQFIFTMEQCFSGGFEDDLQTAPPRVFSSAAPYDNYSYAMSNLVYDEYVYYWISAVRGEDPYGTPVNADTNGDGQVTMDEAFLYAEAHDTAPEVPQYAENPTGLGATVSLDYGDRGTLTGMVTEQGSGAPINASLSAYRQSVGATYRGLADPATGAYSMALPVDMYNVTASAFAYLPVTVNDVEITLDTVTTLDFVLTPALTGTVQGTVSDAGGSPLAGVEVRVLDTPVAPVYTDGAGFYTVDLPGSASYDLRYSLAGHASATETGVPVVEGGVTVRDVTLPDWYRILIWEADPSPLSGAALQSALLELGRDSIVVADLFEYPNPLTDYDAVFVLVGMYPSNYVFSAGSPEAAALVSYLDQGGNVYLEGGDIWCWDSEPATLKSYFHVSPEGDGTGDLLTVGGVAGTFTEGMTFSYTGENSYVDHLGATAPAFEVLTNATVGYGCAVAHDGGTYRTVAASFELGGLVDAAPPSTRQELVGRILEHFGLGDSGLIFADDFESGATSAWSFVVP